MSEAARTILIAFGALAAGFTWQAAHVATTPASLPERLIGELRLAQLGALLLTLSAGAYIGFAIVHENAPGVGLDISLAVGFMIVTRPSLVVSVPVTPLAVTLPPLRTLITRSTTSPASQREVISS